MVLASILGANASDHVSSPKMALMKGLPAWQRWGDEELAYSPRRGRHAVKDVLASTIALVFTLCLGPTLTAAGEPLQPNRPGQADPPTVLKPGVAHIEGGLTFERETKAIPTPIR